MSIIDKYAEYKANKANPTDAVFRRLWDPNFLTPDVYFNMDEIKGRQILRKYNKSSGEPVYVGTYLIIFKTEDLNKFCLIMKRIKDEREVPPQFANDTEFEPDTYIVAEYYPGIHSRIYLRGLSNEALDRVIKKYEQKTRKKLIMR